MSNITELSADLNELKNLRQTAVRQNTQRILDREIK